MKLPSLARNIAACSELDQAVGQGELEVDGSAAYHIELIVSGNTLLNNQIPSQYDMRSRAVG
jgi:hypothetical protein